MSISPPCFRSSRFWSGPSVGWLAVPLDLFASLVLSAMVILNCADVIGRELFNSPIFAATELTRLMIPLVVFAAVPIVGYREEHISVDLVDLVYPKSAINARQIGLTVITMLLMMGVCFQLYVSGNEAREFTEMTEDLRFGLWNIYYFISAMCGLTAFLLLLNLIRYCRNFGPLSPGFEDDEHPSPEPTI